MKPQAALLLDGKIVFYCLPIRDIWKLEKDGLMLRIHLREWEVHATMKDQAELDELYKRLCNKICDYYNPPSLWQKFFHWLHG